MEGIYGILHPGRGAVSPKRSQSQEPQDQGLSGQGATRRCIGPNGTSRVRDPTNAFGAGPPPPRKSVCHRDTCAQEHHESQSPAVGATIEPHFVPTNPAPRRRQVQHQQLLEHHQWHTGFSGPCCTATATRPGPSRRPSEQAEQRIAGAGEAPDRDHAHCVGASGSLARVLPGP